MDTAYHSEFGHTLNYKFDWLPDDPDAQIPVSIRKMIGYMLDDARWPQIQERAQSAVAMGNGDPIAGLWRTIKALLRFSHDSDIAHALQTSDPRIPDVVEVFIRPIDQELLIRANGWGMEDCDGFVLYAGCLLMALGIPASLVTVAADPAEPNRFSHVYLAAYPNGRRLPLDFSHGPEPGWECRHLGRIEEWPIERTMDRRLVIASMLIIVALVWAAKRRRA